MSAHPLIRLGRRLLRALRPPREDPVLARAEVKRVELSVRRLLRRVAAGDRASPFSGAGMEAVAVRPYQEGEPVRGVDWRVTARRDELFVRSYREDRELPVWIVVDRGAATSPAHGGVPAARLQEAHHWLAHAALLAGHPVGVRSCGPGGGDRVPPSRTRRDLPRLLSAASKAPGHGRGPSTLEEALDALADEAPGGAWVAVLSTFDLAPGQGDGLRRAVSRLARRHEVVPVWVDPVEPVPPVGFVSVRMPTGRRYLADTRALAFQEAHEEAARRWRQEVRRVLAPSGTPPVRLRPGDRTETVLARRFAGRARARGRARTLRRAVATLGLVLATAASIPLAAVAVAGQEVLPGSVLVRGDSLLESPVLGAPVLRRTLLETTGGAELAWVPGADPVWEILDGRLAREPSTPGRWVLTTRVVPWWMGAQKLPRLTLDLTDAAGLRRLHLGGLSVRISGPAVPATGPGATRPEPLPGSALRHLVWVPWLLGLVALGGPLRSAAREVAGLRNRPGALRPLAAEGGSPRETLDAVMALLRDWARRRHGVDPSGWTGPEWARWTRSLPLAEADDVRAILRSADAPRFRAARESVPEVVGVVAAVNDLLASRPPTEERP